jgi:hypothetical protein
MAANIATLETPVAILPSTVHSRIKAQKACFTLHGNDKRDIESIFSSQGWQESGRLIKYKIEKSLKPGLTEELANAGITYAVVFPDLDGLAKDLKYQFNIIPQLLSEFDLVYCNSDQRIPISLDLPIPKPEKTLHLVID